MVVAREKLVRPGQSGYYHCVSRVVRRAYLLGTDSFSGKNYNHRKDWVRNRLIFLSGYFSIEVSGYVVMVNHTHTLVKVCPDVAKQWSDEEVAERWLAVFPKRIVQASLSTESLEITIEQMVSEDGLIMKLRKRLTSISWFMRCLNEYIARKANQEDNEEAFIRRCENAGG